MISSSSSSNLPSSSSSSWNYASHVLAKLCASENDPICIVRNKPKETNQTGGERGVYELRNRKTKYSILQNQSKTHVKKTLYTAPHLFYPAVAFPAIHHILFLIRHFQLRYKDVPWSARNILEDPKLKNAVKAYRELLKFTTDRGRIYLSTSRRDFRGTDMLNNDHMMIMFLAVTSTFAMAMVPFARTATTTVTMMYPTVTVMSSMVTTTVATMSVITMTMLMNMMSPAVTMMPSDMTCCTSVMSTGAVVS
ncbi:hypothetical protein LOK49_LG08G02267 [Camellia lanceoleosa]|uniref:Uncharacterized protein n=1 Tax=Camellia lanceoleosa TaxID=1840588 RepID=A0ACC0GV64_9ERIC|nr:hypothetical protein LOK49_LG08G02267 [Camellia lanceoleosa]